MSEEHSGHPHERKENEVETYNPEVQGRMMERIYVRTVEARQNYSKASASRRWFTENLSSFRLTLYIVAIIRFLILGLIFLSVFNLWDAPLSIRIPTLLIPLLVYGGLEYFDLLDKLKAVYCAIDLVTKEVHEAEQEIERTEAEAEYMKKVFQ